MLSLKTTCIHPSTKSPYILSCSGGRNNSLEAARAEYSHAFVVEFANEEDRRYYLASDPAHLGFVKGIAGEVQRVGVVDFVPGVM